MPPLNLVVLHADADKAARTELCTALDPLALRSAVRIWHTGLIAAGKSHRTETEAALAEADVVVLILSSDFLASDIYRSLALESILVRQGVHRVQLVPVRYRDCLLESSALQGLVTLPSAGKPIHEQASRDRCWAEVARHIDKLAQGWSPPASATFTPDERPLESPGGAYSAKWYVLRPTIQQNAIMHLRQAGSPGVLFGPEYSGKSWVLRYLYDHVSRGSTISLPPCKVAWLDLRALEPEDWCDADRFFMGLARQLMASWDDPGDWLAQWRPARDTPAAQLSALLKQLLQQRVGRHEQLVLFIDHVDEAITHPAAQSELSNQFLGLLRAWLNSSKFNPTGDWARLRLILAIAATPGYLIRCNTMSPITDAHLIPMRGLLKAEVESMAEQHGIAKDEPELCNLSHLVGGQPYLIRTALYVAVAEGRSLETLLKDPIYLFGQFLSRLREHLKNANLWEPAKESLNNQSRRLNFDEYQKLLRSGILHESNTASDSLYVCQFPLLSKILTN